MESEKCGLVTAAVLARTPESDAPGSQEIGDGKRGFAAVAAGGGDGDDQLTEGEAGAPGGFHSFVHAHTCIAFRATLALHREERARSEMSVAGCDSAVRFRDRLAGLHSLMIGSGNRLSAALSALRERNFDDEKIGFETFGK